MRGRHPGWLEDRAGWLLALCFAPYVLLGAAITWREWAGMAWVLLAMAAKLWAFAFLGLAAVLCVAWVCVRAGEIYHGRR